MRPVYFSSTVSNHRFDIVETTPGEFAVEVHSRLRSGEWRLVTSKWYASMDDAVRGALGFQAELLSADR